MTLEEKLRERVESVLNIYMIGFAFDGITDKHEFQPHARPKAIADALVRDITENLSYRTVVPQFDAMVPRQEELAIEFCHQIAGPKGQPGSPPDPVRLLEMARDLYLAEVETPSHIAPEPEPQARPVRTVRRHRPKRSG